MYSNCCSDYARERKWCRTKPVNDCGICSSTNLATKSTWTKSWCRSRAQCGTDPCNQKVLQEKPSVLARDDNNSTIFAAASRGGHYTILRKLLDFAEKETGFTSAELVNCQGITPLSVSVLTMMADNFHRTCLHEAACYGHRRTAALLLERGANILGRTKGGQVLSYERCAFLTPSDCFSSCSALWPPSHAPLPSPTDKSSHRGLCVGVDFIQVD